MNGASPTAWPTPPWRWGSCCKSHVPDAARHAVTRRSTGTHSSVGPGSAQRHFAPPSARDKRAPMPKTFRTLDDVDVKGKRVLLRVDLNVPMENGRVSDATRLERVAPTITEISDKGGKVILLAHFGRPKGRDAKDSLKPVAVALGQVIKKPVAFADDCIGEAAAKAVAGMKDGDILCLENTRFHKEEEKNDPAFVAELAKLGDIWVNDAFSAASGPPMPAAPCRPSSMHSARRWTRRPSRSLRSSAAQKSRPRLISWKT